MNTVIEEEEGKGRKRKASQSTAYIHPHSPPALHSPSLHSLFRCLSLTHSSPHPLEYTGVKESGVVIGWMDAELMVILF